MSDGSKSGVVTSPLYPRPYPPGTHCHYEFYGRGRERVRLIFEDFHLFHPGDSTAGCSNADVLQVYVFKGGSLEQSEAACGRGARPVLSTGPRLVAEFRGAHSSPFATGFRIAYEFVTNFGVTSGQQVPDMECAFLYNSSLAGNATSSPNWPGVYPRDLTCHYLFSGAATQRVHLFFTHFDVEGVLPCKEASASDYVEFSNTMKDDPKFSKKCGLLEPFHIYSDGSFFRVTFKSNERLEGGGFHLYYEFLEARDIITPPQLRNSALGVRGVHKPVTMHPTITVVGDDRVASLDKPRNNNRRYENEDI